MRRLQTNCQSGRNPRQVLTTESGAHAYQQLVLDEESSKLTTVNTHRGLFRYRRLPFGISAAPANCSSLWRPYYKVFPEHVFTLMMHWTGTTTEDHLAKSTKVLCLMSSAGRQLKREKCQFMLSQVHYLGHTVSSEGIQPMQDNIRAIRDASAPTDLHQLKSFLGVLNIYAKFLPNLSTVLAPLHSLLQKN